MNFKIIKNMKVIFLGPKVQMEEFLKSNGIKITGLNYNSAQRMQLQGKPKLEGYLGPMWDGVSDGVETIRYECPETYKELSM